jgi:hypothetical protein
MQGIYLLRVDRVEGTETHNVARTIRYATEQLGLTLLEEESGPAWRCFNARIAGSTSEISRLLGVVELAFPRAEVGVERQSPLDEKTPAG